LSVHLSWQQGFLAFVAFRQHNLGEPLGSQRFGYVCVGVAVGALAVWWYQRAGKRRWSWYNEAFAIVVAGIAAIWLIAGLLRLQLFLG
jgi:hypothetical protein